jgi:type IV conjugative transfer system coupling protein TraD
MNSISELVPLLLCSVALQGVFLAWRRLSHTWDSWFPPFQKTAKALLWACVGGLLLALIILFFRESSVEALHKGAAIALGLGSFAIFKRFVKGGAPKERTERGAVIASAQDVKTQVKAAVKKTGQSADLVIGGVPIPKDAEPYHFLVSGSTGSGKSVAIRGMLDVLRARGDTVILVDSGGEFMSKYWDEQKDIVLNPFDSRCAPWSPLAEIEGPWDTGALARSIVPDGTGETKEWNSYAQTFLSSCMQALSAQGRTKLSDLLWAVQQASMKELQPLLSGTPAASQLGSEKTFGSIRTIAGNYMSSYNYLEDNDEDAFSVSEFVKHAQGNFLYLTYRDDQLDSIRHMLSCVLDIAARAILSLQPDPNRRVWLIIDEFASIGKVQSIEAVATKARKVGGCLVIGIQSIAQLKDRYGEHQAQSILSCLSNSLTLRCSDGDTAELMSRNLGEAEVVRATAGSSTSDTGIDSRSWNEQKTTQRLVMPSELQQLKNLQGYLKISGSYPVCEVKLVPPKNRETATSPFESRDFRAKPLMGMSATASLVSKAPAQPVAAAPSLPEVTQVVRAPAPFQHNASAGLQPVASRPTPVEEDIGERAPTLAEPVRATAPAVAQPRAEIVVTLRPRKSLVAAVPPPAALPQEVTPAASSPVQLPAAPVPAASLAPASPRASTPAPASSAATAGTDERQAELSRDRERTERAEVSRAVPAPASKRPAPAPSGDAPRPKAAAPSEKPSTEVDKKTMPMQQRGDQKPMTKPPATKAEHRQPVPVTPARAAAAGVPLAVQPEKTSAAAAETTLKPDALAAAAAPRQSAGRRQRGGRAR